MASPSGTHPVMNFSSMHTSTTYTQGGRSTSFSIMELTLRSATMIRSFGDTVENIGWSPRCSWWTSFVSD